MDNWSPPPPFNRRCTACGKRRFRLLEDAYQAIIAQWRTYDQLYEVYRCPYGGYHITDIVKKLSRRRKRRYGDDFIRRIELIGWLLVLRAADEAADTHRTTDRGTGANRRSNVVPAVHGLSGLEQPPSIRELQPNVQGTSRDHPEGGRARVVHAPDPAVAAITASTGADIVGASNGNDDEQEWKLSARTARILIKTGALALVIAFAAALILASAGCGNRQEPQVCATYQAQDGSWREEDHELLDDDPCDTDDAYEKARKPKVVKTTAPAKPQPAKTTRKK